MFGRLMDGSYEGSLNRKSVGRIVNFSERLEKVGLICKG